MPREIKPEEDLTSKSVKQLRAEINRRKKELEKREKNEQSGKKGKGKGFATSETFRIT